MKKPSAIKIMVVEDETIVALDLQNRLTKLGYQVPAVLSTGEEAITKVPQVAPDVVLMDIMLAGEIDGIKAATEIYQQFDIPVIFLTAYADNRTLQAAKLTEPYGYVLKPFEERELHTTVEMGLYRHKLERELRQSRQWFATTLKCIGDAVIATDAHGRIVFMNPVAESLTGWQEKEAAGKDLNEVFNIINEETRTTVENPATQALRNGIVTGLANHTILIAKGGKETPIDDSAAPIRNEQNQIIGVVLVFRDVTERKCAEAQIRRHNEELEALVQKRTAQIQLLERQRGENEKLAATGRMAARIAHEINNPLAGIKNSFLLIKDYIPRDAPEYEYVPRIQKEIERVASIVQQMYNLYRPEENMPRALPVSDAIREVITLIQSNANERKVRLAIDMQAVADVKIKSAPMLRQILFNLVQNAVEASPVESEVRVHATTCDGFILIKVADQGCGIPEAIHTQIFEPFFTTKNAGSTGGLGLGLSISKNLIESARGSIHFNSTPNHGTTFEFSLPLITDSEVAPFALKPD